MATVRMPISLQAQITRSAISPRLAMRTLRMAGAQSEEGLSVLNRLAVLDETLDDLACAVALDFVHQLHGFNDAEHLSGFHLVSDLDERRRARRRRLVKRSDNRRLHDVQIRL